MAEAPSFPSLIRRVRAGDADAAAELVRTYEPQIRRVVRVRLTDPRLRRLLDVTDICQSVLGNFFIRAASGQFELETPEQLLKLLATMARNKITDWARKAQAGRRDHDAVPLDASGVKEPAAPDPSPSRIVADRELLKEVQARLSEEERYLADQRSGGREWDDLASELGAKPQTLRMRLTRALDRVAQELGL
jgi:RNA polymerase sigma-70 factor (ECF subfamily)